ncbi:MAG: tRNA adenosine(34) deaminase TadA [Legionella sp.]|jgi:tRNA(adenine34) deaminase|nr:tRNA adenosine(34) deaminase TadA [Legionella sp.]
MDDLGWMQHAYQLALQAESAGEVPVGAVLVSRHGELLGSGFNQVMTRHDPTAHAEVLALREAAEKMKNYRLLDSTLYVTLEPCSMCAGALLQARCTRVVFATRDLKTGAAGSVFNLLGSEALNHRLQIDEGPLQAESAALLSNFFKQRRI